MFLFLTTSFSFSQGLPPDFIKQQEEWLKILKKDNPQLYEFEKELLDIQKKIEELVKEYQRVKEVYIEGSKKAQKLKEIKEELRPLIKQQIEIRSNPDYQAEAQLEMLLRVREREGILRKPDKRAFKRDR
jgi:polyribonucleotide nucleotidyltransferase